MDVSLDQLSQQVQGYGGSLGALLSGNWRSDQLLLAFIALFGFSFLRRLALTSVHGLLPLLLLFAFMFHKDPGSHPQLMALTHGDDWWSKLTSHRLFIPCAALFGLLLVNRLRTLSLGAGLAFLAAVLLLTGHQVALPHSAQESTVHRMLLLGCAAVGVLAIGRFVLLRFLLPNPYLLSPYARMIAPHLRVTPKRAALIRASISAVSLAILVVLYFDPQLFKKLSWWKPGYSPIAFSVAAISLALCYCRSEAAPARPHAVNNSAISQ